MMRRRRTAKPSVRWSRLVDNLNVLTVGGANAVSSAVFETLLATPEAGFNTIAGAAAVNDVNLTVLRLHIVYRMFGQLVTAPGGHNNMISCVVGVYAGAPITLGGTVPDPALGTVHDKRVDWLGTHWHVAQSANTEVFGFGDEVHVMEFDIKAKRKLDSTEGLWITCSVGVTGTAGQLGTLSFVNLSYASAALWMNSPRR